MIFRVDVIFTQLIFVVSIHLRILACPASLSPPQLLCCYCVTGCDVIISSIHFDIVLFALLRKHLKNAISEISKRHRIELKSTIETIKEKRMQAQAYERIFHMKKKLRNHKVYMLNLIEPFANWKCNFSGRIEGNHEHLHTEIMNRID